MPEQTYYLSPYCVFYFDPETRVVKLVNGRYGSHFELSQDLWQLLAPAFVGKGIDDLLRDQPQELKAAVRQLIEEKILINEIESEKLGRTKVFTNRLQPVELAVQRGFNEGGYFPDRVDHENPPSPVKETATDEGISLAYHSDFDLDPDFTACLMQRQSIRSFSRHPLTKQQLEQFLQLSARANAIVETPDLGWISYRHYPSPGGRHALEIYPVVFNIEDIDAGLYHYNPVLHCLEPMQSTPQLRELLWQNTLHKMGTAATGSPAVLFIVSAVFARTCWKYRGMPYQAVLMETGALYQTMYLVATQLGLAPCGIGAFPELATAEILQLDPLDEAQTGLFVLGLPDDEAHDTLTIHRVRLLDHPPYAIQWNNKVLELTFRQGMKEVIAPERLALYTTDSGVLSCRVMGGRHRAGFEPGAEAEILRILRPEK